MSEFHFADELLSAIEDRGGAPVCVGVDPVFDRMPKDLQRDSADEAERVEAISEFCYGVLDVVAPIVPAVKFQSACFEHYGSGGVELLRQAIAFAQDRDLLVISDVKRGDIGSTAGEYAAGHLRGLATQYGPTPGVADAITVNGYFGVDGLLPFVELASSEARGVFVLVRTSNPSAKQVQDFADTTGRKVFEHVAEMVAELGNKPELVGDRGYSCVGAVVGATWPAEARALREVMPQQIFLVPGYGAQGATAEDCMASFKPDGTGAIVNASRSVLYAGGPDAKDWKKAVESAAKDFAADIRSAVATLGE